MKEGGEALTMYLYLYEGAQAATIEGCVGGGNSLFVNDIMNLEGSFQIGKER